MYQYYCLYLYSVIAGIALAVHLIINWQQLVQWRNARLPPWMREFRRFLFGLLAFYAADFLWGILAGMKLAAALYIDTIVFFLLMALSVYLWTRYVAIYLEVSGRMRTGLLTLGRGILGFATISLVINMFTDSFFAIDDKCVYSEGPLRDWVLWLQVAMNAIGSCATLHALRRTTGAVRRRNVMVMTFGLIMMAAIVLQVSNPLLPLYTLGCLFGSCLLHVFVFETDRDEAHKREILAREYEARLEAERAASHAKSLFFSSVSHDIRTPLNAILGFSELLESGAGDETERRHFVSSIRSSSKVLARLVDDILDLSKLEIGKMEVAEEPTDVPALVQDVIAVCEVVRLRKSLDLKAEICEMPWVSVDPHRVRQILFNLLSNAYKYTKRGTVTVTVGWQDGTLTLSVADTGVGISESDLTRILQPFVQIVDRNNRNGTGLGLPICQKLAELMNGDLKITSKLGVGSTFTVTLRGVRTVEPPAQPQAEAPAQPQAAAGGGAARQARVLVVDDSRMNRLVLKALLAKCGVTDVVMAENGREALERLKEGGSRFDMVLTDLWMPEMDGRALVDAIRADAALAGLKVYLVTADVEARGNDESRGCAGVILKPLTLDKLRPLFSHP